MTVFARYADLLRGRGTALPLLASLVGRLSLGMTGLAVLLLVVDSTGSYASGGLVSAAYALAFGVLGPVRARSADRRGPVRALLLTGLLHPPALVVLALLAGRGAPTWVLVVAAAVGGASVPPLGPVMRALWASALTSSGLTGGGLTGGGRPDEGRELATAYSLESVVVELCFVLGPLLTATLALVDPAAAVLTAAGLALVGALAMAATPALRAVPPHPRPAGSGSGPLSSPAVRALLLTTAGVGLSFGAVETALPAFVEAQGSRPAAAGVLLAVWSVGSIVGGLVYGGLDLRLPHARQLPVLVGALAVGTALPLLAPGLVSMGVALFLAGLTVAPFLACNSVLLSAAAPTGTTTEAFAWNASMIFGGAAFGTAAAGYLAEHSGPTAALAVSTAAGGLALLASQMARVRQAAGSRALADQAPA